MTGSSPEELASMTVAQLKQLCRDAGLKVSGLKRELVDRLRFAEIADDTDALILDDEDVEPVVEEVQEVTAELDASREAKVAQLRERLLSEMEKQREVEAEGEVLEAEILEADVLDAEFDDEPFEADLLDADIIEVEEVFKPKAVSPLDAAAQVSRSTRNVLTRPSTLAVLVVLSLLAGGGYWYYTTNLDPFIADPTTYGDRMDFGINSGSLDIEGEEMVRAFDDATGGALQDVCTEMHISFTGVGHVAVARGTTSQLIDGSDTELIGAVRAQGPYGRTFLAVEQELEHSLSATFSGKTLVLDKCTTSFERSGYAFDQTTTTWTEVTDKTLLRSDSEVSLERDGVINRNRAVSYGLPTASLTEFLPELLLPLKPVDLHNLFGNALLKPGNTGANDGWTWTVGDVIPTSDNLGLKVYVKNTDVEQCLGHAQMTLHVIPGSPWPVMQQVDMKIEKPRHDSPTCGAFTELLLDQAFPDGALKLRYTMTRLTHSEGVGMIDWGAGYGGRPRAGDDVPEPGEAWGQEGLHMPDSASASETSRQWLLEAGVQCIITNAGDASDAAAAFSNGGYVWRAHDTRGQGAPQWNVSWVDANGAGWVIVERTDTDGSCQVVTKGGYDSDAAPDFKRDGIPETLSIGEVEQRLADADRYPVLANEILTSGELRDDVSIGYVLQLPPDSGDLLDFSSLLDQYREGGVVVNGEREWSEAGFSHTLSYAIDAERARMVGWVISSSNS